MPKRILNAALEDKTDAHLSAEYREFSMYVVKSEGANFRLDMLSDLQNRSVEDIMICCVDSHKGFPDAPKETVLLCIVHQIRNYQIT